MPTNINYEYASAEKKFLSAKTDGEKLVALEEMMRTMPKHKSAEALRKNIKTRYKKIKEEIEKKKQTKKSQAKKLGIKKAEMQAVLVGLTNSGKSSLLACLTNATPEIASYYYTTKSPVLGTLDYEDVKIQMIDMPAVENELCDLGIINTADTILIVIESLEQIQQIEQFLENATLNRIIVFNKADSLDKNEKRKLSAFLQSKKYNFILFSCKEKEHENIKELKERIFRSFNKIRVYTKEPGKPLDLNSEPVIMPKGSSVRDVAEKILHGLSSQVKEARVTGPSSKFPNQKVSLGHEVKDKDIVEFHAR